MAPDRIYRFSIWLPLIVPLAVIAIMNLLIKGLGMPKPSGFVDVALEALAYSAIYGGLPYILLAAWGTWWIRGRSEPDIRRLMFLAPLLMVALFAVACLVMGAVADRMRIWIAVAGLGIGIIIPLGYAYVALTLVLRRWLGPRSIEGAI
jgi:hypothetical protein